MQVDIPHMRLVLRFYLTNFNVKQKSRPNKKVFIFNLSSSLKVVCTEQKLLTLTKQVLASDSGGGKLSSKLHLIFLGTCFSLQHIRLTLVPGGLILLQSVLLLLADSSEWGRLFPCCTGFTSECLCLPVARSCFTQGLSAGINMQHSNCRSLFTLFAESSTNTSSG
jgi:hypothetical protein